MTTADKYREAGVNIDAGNEAAKRYSNIAARTIRSGMLGGIGGFAGGFELDVAKYPNPVLMSGTDGVGTKLKIAFATNRHDTIGIDCVAMCANDILTSGAEPLFFLDYLAVGRLDVDVAAAIVDGVAIGCEQAGCGLVGGETAEMPDVYQDGEYDLAGTVVGVVNKSDIIAGTDMGPGDAIIGLMSNGVHSNGYSLVRKLVREAGLDWNDSVNGWRGTVADELLRPTRIYVKSILALRDEGVPIRGMAHITGGGLVDNVPRCLADGLCAEIVPRSWPKPAVFDWLAAAADMSFEDAARVWNMGIGYVVVVPVTEAERTMEILSEAGEICFVIGQTARASVGKDKRVVWKESF